MFTDKKKEGSFKNDITLKGWVGQSYFNEKMLQKLSRVGLFIKRNVT